MSADRSGGGERGILVTGTSGLLGATLVHALRADRRSVTAAYNRHALAIPGVAATRVDLTSRESVIRLIDEVRPAWVVHCAAATGVDWCEENPEQAHRINAAAAGHIAAAAAELGSEMIYISTDSVFGGERGGYTESDEPEPLNAYARSKLAGEGAVRAALPGSLVLRTNLYGWNLQPKESLAEWVLSRLAGGEGVPGFTDVTFSPLLANDLTDLILACMDRRLSGTYHLASEDVCSKYDFARMIAKEFGYDAGMVVPSVLAGAALRAPRPHHTALVATKASEALGRAMPTLVSGLARFHDLHRRGYPTQLKSYAAD